MAPVLAEVVPALVEEALKALPIPKVMRWGDGEAQFVRPVHGLVMMHGTQRRPRQRARPAIRNRTRGHRFMGKGEVVLGDAQEYERTLREHGMVIAELRRAQGADRGRAEGTGRARPRGARRLRGAARRSDRAGRVSERLRRRLRRRVPRSAAGVPDPHDEAEPEVLSAFR